METAQSPKRHARFVALVFALAWALAGCSSPHREPLVVPRMEASGQFQNGQLAMVVHLGGIHDFPFKQGSAERELGGTPNGQPPRGHGRHGGDHEGPPGGPGGEPNRPVDEEGPTPHLQTVNYPPVRIQIEFRNNGAAPVDVSVSTFSSVLGNFVVTPEKFSVAPGASIDSDPMISRLGIPEGDIPVKVEIKTNGQTEAQVLTLKLTADQPPGATMR